MKKIFFAAIAAVALASCTNESFIEPIVNDDVQTRQIISHTIPVYEAMASLQAYLDTEQRNGTRARSSRKVENVKKVVCSRGLTRSSEGLDADTILYVANFENDEGYAIMAADDRIQDDILAITDAGTITDNDINNSLDYFDENSRPFFEGFPTTGPGFFTDEEYGDEVFINPNTIELYDAERDDTLIGNYDVSDYSFANNAKSEGEIVLDMCIDYATSEMGRNPKDPFPGFDPNPDLPVSVDGEEPRDPYLHKTLINTEVVVTNSKSPMLTDFVSWKQEGVFNFLYPVRRKYVVVGPSKRAAAGCFPMALAKVMTYFESPSDFRYGDYAINWSAIKQQSRIGFPNVDRKQKEPPAGEGNASAMRLFKRLSEDLDCLFFYEGTFTWPREVSSFLRYTGYNSNGSAHNYEYRFDRVMSMLDDGRPVIIYGLPGVKFWDAHAWNIDGYKITKWRKKYVRHWVTDNVNDMTNIHDTIVEDLPQFEKVHCDFGWQGRHNGYYVSGIFKLNGENVEHTGPSGSDKTHFNKMVKIIMYDKPVK